ncbi:MAG TPA: hypothetical protein VGO59_11250 [Verrucomicrobiae bacterium]|jgi:hypothetical protein
MNPLSLLTKGRTIRGLKERPGPYKLLTKSTLPNFSGAKSPVPITSHPEVSQQALFEPKPPAPVEPKAESVPAPAPAAAQPAPAPVPVKEAPEKAQGMGRLADRMANWLRERTPWRGERPSRKPAVQTELALDKVKVIRNDLTQDDVEIIAVDKITEKTKAAEKKAGNPFRRKEPEQTSVNP